MPMPMSRPMRRTVRALSATALTAAALGTATTAATANPTAEVSPRTVAPGDTVTVSVSCEPTGGPAPETVEASSQAFEQGTVELHKAAGDDDTAAGPAYSGTARIAVTAKPEAGGKSEGDTTFEGGADFEDRAPDAVGKTSEWGVDGVCPAAPGGQGKPWSASFTVSGASGESSRGTVVEHGVRAGAGGTFTDSPIALGAGGALIAGALGAAVHRLRRREPSPKG
ncbi:hypothetical protein [Streptomyces sp. NPDC050704]|uniref:hypothetical protein n=1 Tax=Streptomyces sp. NPDC050704 TaxID=3157219 RepID=UPI0034207A4E